jgi:hypothetical protein
MFLDATSTMSAKREMPAQAPDDFEWVNSWAATTLPPASAPAVVPEVTPPVAARVERPIPIAPIQPLAIEAALAECPQAAASLAAAPFPAEPGARAPAAVVDAPAAVVDAPAAVATMVPPGPPDPVDSEVVPDVALAPFGSEAADEPDTAAAASSAPADTVAESVASADDGGVSPTSDDEPRPSAPISFLDFARRAKSSLLGIVARTADPQPQPEAAPLEDISDLTDPLAAGVTLSPESAPTIVPDQLERDIAEIEVRRDALFAEWERSRRIAVDPVGRARTTDYVPILLGCVLGFTLLVVFGAAASFVSLR